MFIEDLHGFLAVTRLEDGIAGARQRGRKELRPAGSSSTSRIVSCDMTWVVNQCRDAVATMAEVGTALAKGSGVLELARHHASVSPGARRSTPRRRSIARSTSQQKSAHENPTSQPARTSVG